MQHGEQIECAVLVGALLGAGAVALGRGLARGGAAGRRRALLLGATAIGALALRLVVVRATFLHANLHGNEIVDAILDFPAPCTSRGASFGQASFMVLGLIARLGGGRFEAIAAGNQLLGVLLLAAIGIAAARWSGRPACAPLAVLLGALWPPLARVAASEDAHTLGVLLGAVALVAIDVYVERRDRAALAAAAAAAALMVCTRQTMYLWAPGVFLLALGRGGLGLLRRAELLAAGGVVALALGLRLAATLLHESGEVGLLGVMFSRASLVAALLRGHPLVDLGRFSLGMTPLALLGAWLLRRDGVGRAALALAAASFLFTLPFGFPIAGVELAFRLPVSALTLALGAVGAARLVERRWIGGVAVAAAALVPLVLSGARVLTDEAPLRAEYRFLEQAAAELPRAFTLVELPLRDPKISYPLPRALFRRAGRDVRFVDAAALRQADFAAAPVYFLAGVACRGRSVAELMGPRDVTLALLQDLFAATLAHRVFGDLRAPASLRPECERLLARGRPVRAVHLPAPDDENPFVLYAGAPLDLQLVRLEAPP